MNTNNIARNRGIYEPLLNLLPNSEIYLFEYSEYEQDYLFLLAGGQELGKNKLNPNEIIGRTLKQAFPNRWAEFELHYQRTWQGEEFTFEKEVDGKIYFFHFYPFKQDNQVVFGVALAHNISYHKNSEDLLQKINEHLIKINWDFSHRIRSNIARILGLLALYELEQRERPLWQKILGFFGFHQHRKHNLEFFFSHVQDNVKQLDQEVYKFTKQTDDFIIETEGEKSLEIA